MVSPKKLDALLKLLRKHGVQQFRDGELALVLSPFPLEEELPALRPKKANAPPPNPRDEDPLWDHTR